MVFIWSTNIEINKSKEYNGSSRLTIRRTNGGKFYTREAEIYRKL